MPGAYRDQFRMRPVLVPSVLRLDIARHQGGVQLVLVIVIVREGGVHLRQGEIRILFDDLGSTIAMGHVIRNDVNHSVTSAVNAQDPARIDREMRIGHDTPSS
jgi:hypothetical protein